MTHPITRYLEQTGLPAAQLAVWAGVGEASIRLYQKGAPIPRDRAALLSAATKGALTIEELLYPEGLPVDAKMTSDE